MKTLIKLSFPDMNYGLTQSKFAILIIGKHLLQTSSMYRICQGVGPIFGNSLKENKLFKLIKQKRKSRKNIEVCWY